MTTRSPSPATAAPLGMIDSLRDGDDPDRLHFAAPWLAERLRHTVLAPHAEKLVEALRASAERLHHGDLARWREAVHSMPRSPLADVDLDQDAITLRLADDRPEDAAQRLAALQQLRPWRKGPFRIDDIVIDSEWQCQRKWSRIAPLIDSLSGRRVLDVGCGNGYYLWRMRAAGASTVVGIDPGVLFYMQFQAVQRYLQDQAVIHLPLALEALPTRLTPFDTVFSMGVLYHRREPVAHLQALRAALQPTGQLGLATLILPGSADEEHTIDGRYARMRNIWSLPTTTRVTHWLRQAGFTSVRCVSETVTETDEQRSTDWMPWQSLVDALDPQAPDMTIEGLPRPRRAVLLARPDGDTDG